MRLLQDLALRARVYGIDPLHVSVEERGGSKLASQMECRNLMKTSLDQHFQGHRRLVSSPFRTTVDSKKLEYGTWTIYAVFSSSLGFGVGSHIPAFWLLL